MEGYNISLIGKSGVGKSSLLNYLFGEELAPAATGKPQTKQGFHLKKGLIEGKKVNIYDSWGLEAGKEETWKKEFQTFHQEKQRESNVKKWLHTVIYCISGEGKRVEDFELDILKNVQKEHLKPIVVITKADSRSVEEFSEKVQELIGIQPVLVNSVRKTKGFGAKVKIQEPFGKELLLEKVRKTTGESLKERIDFLLNKKVATAKANLRSELEKILQSELEKKSIAGLISKKRISEIQEILNRSVQSRNEAISIELSRIAIEASRFYKNTIAEVLKPTLAEDFQIEVEEEVKSFFSAFIPGVAIMVGFMPWVALVVGLASFFPSGIKDTLPTVSKSTVMEIFNQEWGVEKENFV